MFTTMEKVSKISRKKYSINGVYRITNIKNNKFYIGSSSSKTYIYTRIKHHYGDLKNNKHVNKYLQNAWNKYGEDFFYFDIIEECIPEKCLEKEQFWINVLNPHYNFCKIAGSTLGRIVSQETKDKISQSNKEYFKTEKGLELKIKISNLRKGKPGIKHTEEHKNHISKLLKGREFSEETKLKMRKPKLNKKRKVINIITKEIYNSIEDYSKNHNNISIHYVSALCRKERSSRKHPIEYVK